MNFCLHNDTDIGITLTTTEAGLRIVHPICENCQELVGDGAPLIDLFEMSASMEEE